MKESRFIEKNQEKWKAFEKANLMQGQKPGQLSRLFIQFTDDLSYARTFYPNRFVRVYLNGLAQSVLLNINKKVVFGWKDFVKFWAVTLPIANYNARREFSISLIVFVTSFLIGILSTKNDPEFAEMILGHNYIDKTIDNIQSGDPMGIYKSFVPIEGFLHITLNNLFVAAWTLVLGIFASFGTIYILIVNGVMVGTFQQFFIEQGHSDIFFLTVWQHGAMELTSIVIAGAAGLQLGSGLLFPGTYKRSQSFRMSALRGLKIFLGIIPPIIIAGFIEAYYTRLTELPVFLRLATIFVPFLLMIYYYFVYPRKAAKKFPSEAEISDNIELFDTQNPDLENLASDGNLAENTLRAMAAVIKTALVPILFISFCFGIAAFWLFKIVAYNDSGNLSYYDATEILSFQILKMLFNFDEHPVMFIVNFVLVGFLFFFIFRAFAILSNSAGEKLKKSNFMRVLVFSTIFSLMINLPFFLGLTEGFLLFLGLLPFLSIIGIAYTGRDLSFFEAIGSGARMLFVNIGKTLELLLMTGFSILIISLLFNVLGSKLSEMILSLLGNTTQKIYIIFYFTLLFFTVIGGLVLFISTFLIVYHRNYELSTAEKLFERIENFGNSKKILGYEREK